MSIVEVQAKSLLRRSRRIDSWFVSSAGMNLYRGCQHRCAYCDGRAEKYRFDRPFGLDVEVKVNALEVLRRELGTPRRRARFASGFVVVGGGVCDAYQPLEERYGLTRSVLELLEEQGLPVHVLTKSALVERDADVLRRIGARSRAVVSFSFSSMDDALSAVFEPSADPPSSRLRAIAALTAQGISCGAYLMPLLPFLQDTPAAIAACLARCRAAGAAFTIPAGLTLKDGRQKDHFLGVLEGYDPRLAPAYRSLYRGDRWGVSIRPYGQALHEAILEAHRRVRLPLRMPPELFSSVVSPSDQCLVVLEQLDALWRLRGRPGPFARAVRRLEATGDPRSLLRADAGLGLDAESAQGLEEIVESGTAKRYEEMLYGGAQTPS